MKQRTYPVPSFPDANVEPDTSGLIWSLRIPGRDGEPDWEWRHYDLVYAQARRIIDADAAMPEFARAILLSSDEIPRIVEDDGIIAGVLPDYARTGDVQELTLTVWHFALGRGWLISSRRAASRALMHMWETIERGSAPSGAGELVELCIVDFAKQVRNHVAKLAATLDPVEDVLIQPRDPSQLADIGGKLGSARREATQIKRILLPLARVLDDEDEELQEWSRIADHDTSLRLVNSALDDIAALTDQARSLQDELTTRLAEETNRRLYIVSVVTTLVMPATFVTGFFGINTGGLLWSGEEAHHGTLFAGLVCLAAVLLTIILLRWKRLF